MSESKRHQGAEEAEDLPITRAAWKRLMHKEQIESIGADSYEVATEQLRGFLRKTIQHSAHFMFSDERVTLKENDVIHGLELQGIKVAGKNDQ